MAPSLGSEHAFNAQTAPNRMQSADSSPRRHRSRCPVLQGFPSDSGRKPHCLEKRGFPRSSPGLAIGVFGSRPRLSAASPTSSRSSQWATDWAMANSIGPTAARTWLWLVDSRLTDVDHDSRSVRFESRQCSTRSRRRGRSVLLQWVRGSHGGCRTKGVCPAGLRPFGDGAELHRV
jgi:hypothetical protein